MREQIYLDHAATTPVAERVLEAMLPYFRQNFGNAHSRSHAAGWGAAAAVKQARQQLANLLHCQAAEITFTSGATEAIALALTGIAAKHCVRGRHIITTRVEHSAVLSTCQQLEKQGYEVTYLPVNQRGIVEEEILRAALRADTILAAFIWGNNETGVLQDLQSLVEICHARGTLVFADATQVVGKVNCELDAILVDALCCSGHKFYGPKGVGALFLRAGSFATGIEPLWGGGGQEDGLRGGTLNVPAIVGMGAAAVLAKAEMASTAQRLERLRKDFEGELCARISACVVNGAGAARLPQIINISFRFTEAEALLSRLHRRLAVSTGSACSSADLEPSHVLLAMGLDREDARAAVRVSLGRDTTAAELQEAAQLLIAGVEALRAESPLWELYVDGVL